MQLGSLPIDVVVLEHELCGVLGVIHDQGEEVVADAHHPHEDRDDRRQHKALQILFLRVQFHVDDIVGHY